MFIIQSYFLAVVFCFITMLCWGSWGNTQKMAGGVWRYELFYWDYVIGVLLLSLLAAFTMGSVGDAGRSFVPDLMQADQSSLLMALVGGIIFNLSNILLSAAVSIAGLSVAFPLGVGLALVLGVFINYFTVPQGNPWLLFFGVALVMVAIVVNAIAYKKLGSKEKKAVQTKGFVIAVVAGVLMSSFFKFIAASMDLTNFEAPAMGKMTPYTAMVVFSVGIFLSNILFNTVVMKHPFVGTPTSYKAYFAGNTRMHVVGILGGLIWGVGNLFSLLAAEKAGPAISYGLGQGATMVAAFWGVFVWKEFAGGPKVNRVLLTLMFIFFLLGIGLIIIAGT